MLKLLEGQEHEKYGNLGTAFCPSRDLAKSFRSMLRDLSMATTLVPIREHIYSLDLVRDACVGRRRVENCKQANIIRRLLFVTVYLTRSFDNFERDGERELSRRYWDTYPQRGESVTSELANSTMSTMRKTANDQKKGHLGNLHHSQASAGKL